VPWWRRIGPTRESCNPRTEAKLAGQASGQGRGRTGDLPSFRNAKQCRRVPCGVAGCPLGRYGAIARLWVEARRHSVTTGRGGTILARR
jgi:hypothetical protein